MTIDWRACRRLSLTSRPTRRPDRNPPRHPANNVLPSQIDLTAWSRSPQPQARTYAGVDRGSVSESGWTMVPCLIRRGSDGRDISRTRPLFASRHVNSDDSASRRNTGAGPPQHWMAGPDPARVNPFRRFWNRVSRTRHGAPRRRNLAYGTMSTPGVLPRCTLSLSDLAWQGPLLRLRDRPSKNRHSPAGFARPDARLRPCAHQHRCFRVCRHPGTLRCSE